MTIAVHISAGRQENLRENVNFICFSALARHQPDSHFIFIFDAAPDPEIFLEPNCTPVILPPTIKNSLLRHYWYNYKLPAVIDRYNADIFITDRASCSFRLNTPQCMLLNKDALLAAERNRYLKKFLTAFFRKAYVLFALDEGTFSRLQKNYSLESKTTLLLPGLKNESHPLSYEDREAIKEKVTAGHEYFLHITATHDFEKVKSVLKAFTIFKKWQKSSMQMVLTVQPSFKETLLQQLSSYKYRQDIVVATPGTDSEKIENAAFALLLGKADSHMHAIASMKHKIPVIIDEKHEAQTFFDAAVTTSWDEKMIAEKMMLLYKNESLQNDFIQRGLAASASYSWELTAAKIWEVLKKVTS